MNLIIQGDALPTVLPEKSSPAARRAFDAPIDLFD